MTGAPIELFDFSRFLVRQQVARAHNAEYCVTADYCVARSGKRGFIHDFFC